MKKREERKGERRKDARNGARRPDRSVKKNRIRLSVVNASAVRWLGTNGDRRPDRPVNKNRIRLSVVNAFTIRWLGTNGDRRPDRSVKKNRIRMCSLSLSLSRNERRLTARQISQKEQISSVRRQPFTVRWLASRT